MKAQLAIELTEIRKQINELKRREKILREYFLQDLEKYGKDKKKYGEVFIVLFESERDRVDLDTLHTHYPEVYEKLLSTYTYITLKCQRSA